MWWFSTAHHHQPPISLRQQRLFKGHVWFEGRCWQMFFKVGPAELKFSAMSARSFRFHYLCPSGVWEQRTFRTQTSSWSVYSTGVKHLTLAGRRGCSYRWRAGVQDPIFRARWAVTWNEETLTPLACSTHLFQSRFFPTANQHRN